MSISVRALTGPCFHLCIALHSKVPELFRTPVTIENLDGEVFSEWVDGKETRIATPPGAHPLLAIWTQGSQPDSQGVRFGDSTQLGQRHLRVGFKDDLPVEGLFVAGT